MARCLASIGKTARAVLADYFATVEPIDTPYIVPRDPDLIVPGDADLPDLHTCQDIPVVTPTQALLAIGAW